MLFHHSFLYLIARGVPGVISFAALVLYTRLLSAEEFGRYALVISGVGLVQVLVFQWLHLVLARFLPGNDGEADGVLATILSIFLSLSSVLILVCFGLVLMWPDSVMRPLIALIIPLSIASGWMEICLKLASVRLQPGLYGRMLTGKNVTSLILACVLIGVGLAAAAPLIGLFIGTTLAWFFLGRKVWKGIKPIWPTASVLREYAAYGLPLAITFALGWVVSSSDRIIISYLIDDAATGAYAAGYDLTQQSLGLLLVIVNTAAYPLVMRALTQEGDAAAKKQLCINGELIIAIAMISSAVMIGLAPSIIEIVIGVELRQEAGKVVPWIAAGAAVAGIKAFHLDVAFQLAKDSKWQAYTAAIAAVVNVVLNFMLIPVMGLTGAAVATLASLSLACLLSWWVGRRVFPVPPMSPSIFRAGIVAGFAYIGTLAADLSPGNHLLSLAFGFLMSTLAAVLSGLLVNVCGAREKVLEVLLQRKG